MQKNTKIPTYIEIKRIIICSIMILLLVVVLIVIQVLFGINWINIQHLLIIQISQYSENIGYIDGLELLIWILISGAYILGTILAINKKEKLLLGILLAIISGVTGYFAKRWFQVLFFPCGKNCYQLDFRVWCSQVTIFDKLIGELCDLSFWINIFVMIIFCELLADGIKAKMGGIIGGGIGLIIGYLILVGGLYSIHKMDLSLFLSMPIVLIAICIFQILLIFGMTRGETLLFKKGIRQYMHIRL